MIGQTGVTTGFADFAFAPNGSFYGISYSSAADPSLYRINPSTAAATRIGSLGIGFVFEGAFTISANGIAYGLNQGNAAADNLFTINLATGAASIVGAFSGTNDFNGLTFRSDGRLMGIDHISNALYLIDPVTVTKTLLAALPTDTGAVGGLAIDNNVGYYSTNDSTGRGGSLYRFDPFLGTSTFVEISIPRVLVSLRWRAFQP